MNNELLYNFFTDDDFLRISNKINEMEKITAGEIRVAIKEEKQFLKRNKTTRELAEEEFHKLKMQKSSTSLLFCLLFITP